MHMNLREPNPSQDSKLTQNTNTIASPRTHACHQAVHLESQNWVITHVSPGSTIKATRWLWEFSRNAKATGFWSCKGHHIHTVWHEINHRSYIQAKELP